MNLACFQRPSRYINNELHSVKKNTGVRIALAFPDIYDVGMSHLGLKILYKLINSIPYASAERAFHPWTDLEAYMKENAIPLASLESKRPLKDFDMVGFSLQYELSYTSVLNMLDMGGIPLKSSERTDKHPIVIAGGPCAINPHPMSPFIDAFMVGDAEDSIREITETLFMWKKDGDSRRVSVLKELSNIEGIYVPSINTSVKRRYVASLEEDSYPTRPIIPYTQIVHDRVNVEVSRGCIMGCRYCQAGMIYRPLRERTAESALRLAEESIRSTGYEEVSFTSLSAGDYSELIPLLRGFNKRFEGKNISISLPSLRVKAVNEDVLREIKSVRKTGFTIAPEAGSDRLRHAINKDFKEEDFERALGALFKEGWLNLKLYYMIGLPTETDKDIEAIREMVRKALKIAKGFTRKSVNFNVSVSPFVPKPHTPFQWCAQQDILEIKRKKNFLRNSLKGITIKGHDERMSMLEAAFSRGDTGISALIESAFRLGSRLDGWTESFDYSIWERAMSNTGIDAAEYAKKAYGIDEALPWDNIQTGIAKDFLKKEYANALDCTMTPDCKNDCSACGLKCPPLSAKPEPSESITVSIRHETSLPRPIRLRVGFSKSGELRYLSHRELINVFTRAINRAEVELDYSKGFHPAPKISFGPPLNVGVAGRMEYFDMEVTKYYDLSFLIEKINYTLPEGARINKISVVGKDEPSLQSFISEYEYEIICVNPDEAGNALEKMRAFIDGDMDNAILKNMLTGFSSIDEKTFLFILKDTASKKVKLEEAILELFGINLRDIQIERIGLYGYIDGVRNEPL